MKLPRPVRDLSGQFAALALLAAVGAAYANSLDAPFVFDDEKSILENATLRQLRLVWPVLLYPPGHGSTVQGRPLLNLTLALNYARGGTDVRGYHLVNVGIHALAALTLFGLVRRTLRLPGVSPGSGGVGATAAAFATALLWAVHPLQTESVTYTVQRAESLAGLWYLLTLYCGAGSPRPAPWSALAVLCCALGVCTKEVVAGAPLLVLLYDRVFLAPSFREALRRRPGLYAGLAGTWLVLAALVAGAGGRGGTAGFGSGVGWWAYARTQAVYVLWYLRLAFWPRPLALDYGTDTVDDPRAVVPSLLAILALLAATALALRRRPRAGFLAAAFFVLLAPSSSFVPVATQTAAEHRMYLALAPVVVLAVLGAAWAARRLPRPAPAVALAAAAAALGALTYARNEDYRSEQGIWEDTARKVPGNVRAHLRLAYLAFRAGRVDEAGGRYDLAVRLRPDSGEARVGRALFFATTGRPEAARRDFDEAVRRDADGECYAARGLYRSKAGETGLAIADFGEALRRRPSAENYNRRAVEYAKAKRSDAAEQDYAAAASLDPSQPMPFYNRGMLYLGSGRPGAAAADFTRALTLDPSEPRFLVARSDAFAAQGQLDRAADDLSAAVRLDPSAQYYYLRAVVYRRSARYDLAIDDLTRTVERDPGRAPAYLVRAFCYLQQRDLPHARADAARYEQLGGKLDPQLEKLLRGRP